MKATIHNYLEAMKQRREEEGEKGFSLIELIVVVVILGILAAVAIPIFLNIQAQARDSAAQAAAANGATQASASLAQSASAIASGNTASFANLVEGSVTAVTLVEYAAPDIDTICVGATVTGGTRSAGSSIWYSGPGCASATTP
jgi:prepilin-type N-terminal cleavage/methylation domain-containing protein